MQPRLDYSNRSTQQSFSLFYDYSFNTSPASRRSDFKQVLKERVSEALKQLESDFTHLQNLPGLNDSFPLGSKDDVLRSLPKMVFKDISKDGGSSPFNDLRRILPNYAKKISKIGEIFSQNSFQDNELEAAIKLVEAVNEVGTAEIKQVVEEAVVSHAYEYLTNQRHWERQQFALGSVHRLLKSISPGDKTLVFNFYVSVLEWLAVQEIDSTEFPMMIPFLMSFEALKPGDNGELIKAATSVVFDTWKTLGETPFHRLRHAMGYRALDSQLIFGMREAVSKAIEQVINESNTVLKTQKMERTIEKQLNKRGLPQDKKLLDTLLDMLNALPVVREDLWQKVIEVVSKTKLPDIKERLWTVWNRSDKTHLQKEQVTALWEKVFPFVEKAESEEAKRFFFTEMFAQTVGKTHAGKDKEEFSRLYAAAFGKAAQESDPKAVLQRHWELTGKLENYDAGSIFVEKLMPVVDRLMEKKDEQSYPLVLSVYEQMIKKVADAESFSKIIQHLSAVKSRENVPDEERKAIDRLFVAIKKHKAAGRTFLLQELCASSPEVNAGLILRLVLDAGVQWRSGNKLSGISGQHYLSFLCRALNHCSKEEYFEVRQKLIAEADQHSKESAPPVPVREFLDRIMENEIKYGFLNDIREVARVCHLWRASAQTADMLPLLLSKFLEWPNGEKEKSLNFLFARCSILVKTLSEKKALLDADQAKEVSDDHPMVALLKLCHSKINDDGINGENYRKLFARLLSLNEYVPLMNSADTLKSIFPLFLEAFFPEDGEKGDKWRSALVEGEMRNLTQASASLLSTSLQQDLCALAADPVFSAGLLQMVSCVAHETTDRTKKYALLSAGCTFDTAGKETKELGGFINALQDSVKALESIYRSQALSNETRDDYWLVYFDLFIDLIHNLSDCKAGSLEEKRKGAAITNTICKALFLMIDSRMDGDIIQWNAKGKNATKEEMRNLFAPTKVFRTATENILRKNSVEYSYGNKLVKPLLDSLRRSYYTMDDPEDKVRLATRVLEFSTKYMSIGDGDIMNLGLLYDIAHFNGLDKVYFSFRLNNEAKKSFTVLTDCDDFASSDPELNRTSALKLLDYYLNNNGVKGLMQAIHTLEKGNFESFCVDKHALELVPVYRNIIEGVRELFEDERTFLLLLKKHRLLLSFANALLNPVSIHAAHSEGWPGIQFIQGEGRVLQKGITAFTGTDDPEVNRQYLLLMKDAARLMAEVYQKALQLVEDPDDEFFNEVLTAISSFSSIVQTENIIGRKVLIDLTDPKVTGGFDPISRMMLEYYQSLIFAKSRKFIHYFITLMNLN